MTKKGWVAKAMQRADVLPTAPGLFTKGAAEIARGLADAALATRGTRGLVLRRGRRVSPLQSAMSLLNMVQNRAGKNMSAARRAVFAETRPLLRELLKGVEW